MGIYSNYPLNERKFEKAESRFAALNKMVGRGLIRKVARQGAAIARKEAMRTTAFTDRTGTGRKSMVLSERRTTDGSSTYVVGFSRKRQFGRARSGFYLKFIEAGTQPHPIIRGTYLERAAGKTTGKIGLNRKLGSLTEWTGNGTELRIVLPGGRVIIRPLVMHPGVVARPFLGQALNRQRGAILQNAAKVADEAFRQFAHGGSMSD